LDSLNALHVGCHYVLHLAALCQLLCWPNCTEHLLMAFAAIAAAAAAAAAAAQGLTQASAASIAQLLQQHPTLQQLQLSRNSLADAGAHSPLQL
jgi:negative regulator of sigma E activity